MNKGSLITRRCDFTINASVEKITKLASDIKHFYKVMKIVDTCTLISTHGDSSIFLVKGKSITGGEIPREALIGSNVRMGSKYTTVVRSSVELDSFSKPSEGFMRQLVFLSGLMLIPTDKAGVTRVHSMCFVDTNKPYTSETFKAMDNLVIESAMMLKKTCEGSM